MPGNVEVEAVSNISAVMGYKMDSLWTHLCQTPLFSSSGEVTGEGEMTRGRYRLSSMEITGLKTNTAFTQAPALVSVFQTFTVE